MGAGPQALIVSAGPTSVPRASGVRKVAVGNYFFFPALFFAVVFFAVDFFAAAFFVAMALTSFLDCRL